MQNYANNQDNTTIGNIYYVIPDRHNKEFDLRRLLRSIKQKQLFSYINNHWFPKHKPVGGVKVMYQHCLLLQKQGYQAYPLLLGQYHGNFFGYDIETRYIDDTGYHFADNDILIFPEYLPYLGQQFTAGKKIIFVQGAPYINLLPEDSDKSYKALAYDDIWYCSQFLGTRLKEDDFSEHGYISNFIDLSVFKPDDEQRIKGRLLVMPRKRPQDLKTILNTIKSGNVDIFYADNLSEAELVLEYQKSDVFLTTGYPEGFGLPPLEAMACGCVVVGFTGGGGQEFMLNEKTALVAPDGDTDTAAEQVIKALSEEDLSKSLREQGVKIANTYSSEKTAGALSNYFNGLRFE